MLSLGFKVGQREGVEWGGEALQSVAAERHTGRQAGGVTPHMEMKTGCREKPALETRLWEKGSRGVYSAISGQRKGGGR